MDEANNKITMRTYSPYSASLPAAERSFFDVNSLTGVGNTYDGSFDFAKRFAGYEHSSGYDTQQSVISLVRGIGALNVRRRRAKYGNYILLWPHCRIM